MARRRLSDTGEHAWIARLLRRLPASDRDVLVGPGDDAAIVRPGRRPIAITTDSLVEGVHFRRDWFSPRVLGQRAFRVNASDVAAMGGRPWLAVVNLVVPPTIPTAWLDRLMDGFTADARAGGATVVGGNLARGRALCIGVTLLGRIPGPVLSRRGARVGDALWVTGSLGGNGWAVRERLAGRAARWPTLPRRWELGVRLANIARAGIDVSDGLLQDVGHLSRASGVAVEIELARLPCVARCRATPEFAATAGEDYELVFTAPADRAARLAALARQSGCPLTCIGRVVAGPPAVRVIDADGRVRRVAHRGFDHFGTSAA